MASVGKDQLRAEISEILKGADLAQLSAKKVRRQLEAKFGIDLTERKPEIDKMVMDGVTEIQKKQEEAEKSDSEAEDSESDFEEPEDIGPPKKKAKSSKVNDAELARQLQEEEGSGRRRTRQKATPKSRKTAKKKKKSTLIKTSILSEDLAELMGEKEMAKTDVVKRMWAIIKERDLKDPANKQFIICDDQLRKIFGGEERMRPFGMMKYLKDHMTPGGTEKRREVSDDSGDENGAGSGSDNEKPKKKPRKASGYQKPMILSESLAAVMGEKQMPRAEVVKRMWAIIKERNLADPKNRQFMICDSELLKVFGTKRIRTFGMMKYLKDHMFNADDLIDQ